MPITVKKERVRALAGANLRIHHFVNAEVARPLPLNTHPPRNEEVAYKRGLGRPEVKFIYAKSKHGGTQYSLVHNHQALGAAWRRAGAPTNLALGIPADGDANDT